MPLSRALFLQLLFYLPIVSLAQNDVVQWQFIANSRSNGTAVFEAKAIIKPGWHLYSQYLAEGGPIPTKIHFISHTSYSLQDATYEYGSKVQFHDDLYDLDITWYTGSVRFEQVVLPNSFPASIGGMIEYMTCDDHTCIPAKKEFEVIIQRP